MLFSKGKSIVLFLFFIPLLLSGQGKDSLSTSEETDTVVIYKEPLVINKTITIYTNPVRKKNTRILFDLGASAFSYFTYSAVCEDCRTYYTKIKKSTHNSSGYMLNASLFYKPGKLLLGLGIQYALFKSDFNYTDSLNINYASANKSKNTDLTGIVGYWLGDSQKKISFLPSASLTYSKQGKISGELLSLSSNKVEDINNVIAYRPVQYSLGTGIKILYRLKSSAFFYIEPFYRYNLRSIVKTGNPYTIQRHIIGIRIGLFLGI